MPLWIPLIFGVGVEHLIVFDGSYAGHKGIDKILTVVAVHIAVDKPVSPRLVARSLSLPS